MAASHLFNNKKNSKDPQQINFGKRMGAGPWWALPWALPWALGPPLGPPLGLPLGPPLGSPLGPPLGPGGALRGSGPARALGPSGALRGSGPARALGPSGALPWALRGPCGDRALSGPQQIRKEKRCTPSKNNCNYISIL